MSVEKSELKAAFAHSFGCDADDDLSAAEGEVHRCVGQVQSGVLMEGAITQVISKLDDEMRSDTPPFDPDNYRTARRYLNMCLAQVSTHTKRSGNSRLHAEGKVMAYKKTIQRLSKIKETEMQRAQAVRDAEKEAPERRLVGTHPGPPISTKRKAKKKAKRKAKKKTKKR